jgi:hypothetical protein
MCAPLCCVSCVGCEIQGLTEVERDIVVTPVGCNIHDNLNLSVDVNAVKRQVRAYVRVLDG